MIGENIKKLRIDNGLTQKDLADKLYVTSQAVSRWENGEVEPSISTINEMAKIFEVSVDELINGPKEDVIVEPIAPAEPLEPAKPIEEIVSEAVKKVQPKQVLCVCQKCNNPIYNSTDIHRFTVRHHHGRSSSTEEKVYCTRCYNEKLEEERKEKERKLKGQIRKNKKRRILSFVFGGIVAILLLIIGIVQANKGESKAATWLFVACPLAFTFISCWILFNNFIPDMWLNISRWSVKFPGIIFSLDLDGILALIFVKILFGIISFFISALAVLFATALSMFVSLFVYPFALARNIKNRDEFDLD